MAYELAEAELRLRVEGSMESNDPEPPFDRIQSSPLGKSTSYQTKESVLSAVNTVFDQPQFTTDRSTDGSPHE